MSSIKVTINQPSTEIIKVARQGPAGPPGSSGASTFETTNDSGLALSAGRAVSITSGGLVYSDNRIQSTLLSYVGVTTTAAVTGAPIQLQEIGALELTGVSLTPDQPLYVGIDGFLTQVAPEAPGAVYSSIIGYAITPTRVFLTPRSSIILN